ncbi:MAG: hypothetical protein U1E66_08805 [Rhodospirillales bacterium]
MPPLRIALLVGLVVVIAIAAFALIGTNEPPVTRVEQVIPNDHFPR